MDLSTLTMTPPLGTDVLMPEQKIPQFELLDSRKLPEEVQYKIFRGNAIKLLKLEGK